MNTEYKFKYRLSDAENKETRINLAFDMLFEQLEQELRFERGRSIKSGTQFGNVIWNN